MIEEKIISKAIYESAKFLRRDFSEIVFLKDKAKKEFFKRSYGKNLERMQQILLPFNFLIGLMDENKNILKESKNNQYWLILPIDDELNFSNNMPFWGMSVLLLEKIEDDIEVLATAYYMPMMDQLLFTTAQMDVLYKNKKINLAEKLRDEIQLGRTNCNRCLGSDLIHMFYFITESADLAVVEDNFMNNCFVNAFAKKIKAQLVHKNKKIYIGNRASIARF